MSKESYLTRYQLIINKLKSQPLCSYKELSEYLNYKMEERLFMYDTPLIGMSKRTLQRDFKEIRQLFGIDIEYSRAEKGYYIASGQLDSLNFQHVMESFDIFNSLNLAQNMSQYIQLEKRKASGTEHLFGMLYAIKNRFILNFKYTEFWEEKGNKISAKPLLMKEYRHRWYLVAQDKQNHSIRRYGLDRVSELTISNEVFSYPKDFDREKFFEYSYGVMGPDEKMKPEKVVLAFTPEQGNYIKSLLIHPSQKILIDNENETQIELQVYITYDFFMEIMSFENTVTVLEPAHLVERVKNQLKRTLRKYQ